MAGAVFTPNANYDGQASIDVSVNDEGNTGTGGPLSASQTITIDVTPLNHAPVITAAMPSAVDITEDQSYAPPANLVTNGGFESDLSGWTTTGSAGTAGAFIRAVRALYSYLTEATFSQAIATVPGATYQISFWADNPYDTGLETESFTATWGGASGVLAGQHPAVRQLLQFHAVHSRRGCDQHDHYACFRYARYQGYWDWMTCRSRPSA